MSRLLYLVSDPITAGCFLRGQLTYLREAGFDVRLATSPRAGSDFRPEVLWRSWCDVYAELLEENR